HGHTLRVAGDGGAPRLRVLHLEVPATEEAHDHARASSGVRFLPHHGVEEGFAGVLCSSHASVARGGLLPAHDTHASKTAHAWSPALRARFTARVLTEEVVLLRRRQSGVAIGGANHAELV